MSTAGMFEESQSDKIQYSTIQVCDLKKHFPVRKGLFSKISGWIKAVDGIDFHVNRGETFGLVGESGCGKTTTSKCILLMEIPSSGSILFEGKDITTLKGSDFVNYRKSLQVVFQDPTSALNPRMRVRDIVSEPMIAHGRLPRTIVKDRVNQVLEEVGLNSADSHKYPHEFSVGQRQRIAIARALAPKPKCIILDEPVSALDVSIRAQILNLLTELQVNENLAYLVIAHDLAMVKHVSTRTGVMYLGKLVEIAEGDELFMAPLHPYTKALFSAALPKRPCKVQNEIILPGEVPSPLNPPAGCRFNTRCYMAVPQCTEFEPEIREVSNRHFVACHLV